MNEEQVVCVWVYHPHGEGGPISLLMNNTRYCGGFSTPSHAREKLEELLPESTQYAILFEIPTAPLFRSPYAEPLTIAEQNDFLSIA